MCVHVEGVGLGGVYVWCVVCAVSVWCVWCAWGGVCVLGVCVFVCWVRGMCGVGGMRGGCVCVQGVGGVYIGYVWYGGCVCAGCG